jgi:7-cyano-7-deazaguanine synthase in queuosine biosynthesis
MELICKKNDNGLTVNLENKRFQLSFPEEIWQNYPNDIKDVLIDNLIHLLTINLPLIAGFKKLKYNLSTPLFRPYFHRVVINSLPTVADDYKIRTGDAIKEFLSIDYEFKDSNVKIPSYNYRTDNRAIVSLSCGKDSLLSLAVSKEIGLNPVAVYINDTVSPSENRIKMNFGTELCKKFGIDFYIIRNELEKLNDFELWGKDETTIGYTHMVTGFCLMALPFSHHFKASYIVIGNQKNMEFNFYNKDGFLTYPSFDQTKAWMKEQDRLVKTMTSGKTSIMSVIEPLTNIAIIRVLHKRYGEFGKYEVSCDCLDASTEKRWCQNCSKCARLSLFMKANNVSVKNIGFKRNLLEKRYKKLYCLFRGKETDVYEKSEEARDEQLLAFYMAYRNDVKGYLIDLFKKTFLEEAKKREDELIKMFFSIYESDSMPEKIKQSVDRIYNEELKNIF